MQSNAKGQHPLREARRRRGWSQQRLAELSGIGLSTIERAEHGEILRIDSIQRICECLDKTAEQLGLVGGLNLAAEEISPHIPQKIDQAFDSQVITPRIAMLQTATSIHSKPYKQHDWTFSNLRGDIEAAIDQAIKGFEIMSQNQLPGKKLNRRQILNLLKVAPVVAFGLEQSSDSAEEDILARCAVNLPLCWRLYFAGGQQDVRREIPGYLAQLSPLAQSSSLYQKTAAELLAQTHQLAYLLELQAQNFQIAESHVIQAFEYGKLAEDKNLQVSALIRKGNLYHTRKWPLQTLNAYQEALAYSDSSISPLLAGQMYIGLAEANARFSLISHNEQHKQDAQRFARLARESFPANPQTDPHFSYTHFNNFTIANFEGLTHLHLNQANNAWDLFEKVGKDVPQSIVPQRVELVSRQLRTAFVMNDLERCEVLLPIAVDSAIKIESDLRYSEVCDVYENMQFKWGNDRRVKNLADLFVR